MNLTPPDPLWELSGQGDLIDTEATTIAQTWLTAGAWALLLLGGVGRGKSVAAAWLWHRLRHEAVREAQAPGRADRAGDVLWLRARALQRLQWQDRSELLRRCAMAYGLIVDEMGAEDERTSQAIGDVVEERGDGKRRTVMTSNMDRGKFLARYGDRLVSRLRAAGLEDGRAKWVCVVAGGDLRGRGPYGNLGLTKPTEQPVTTEQRELILAEHAPEVAAMIKGIEDEAAS